MHGQQQLKDIAPVNQEPSPPATTATAPADATTSAAVTLQPQAAWKQGWLDQADRRGAIWHAQWKKSLEAKRATRAAAKQKKA
jgi:hypothetical protein